MPNLWKLPFLRWVRRGELTPRILREPAFVRVKGTEISPVLLVVAGFLMVTVNLVALGYDVADTAVRRLWHALRRPFSGRRPAQF